MSADDVSFLARSPNRAAVLSALSDAPCDRGELRERVGASRVTVGRITTDLERRGWIERTGNEYRATTAGAVVVAAYERFVDVVEAADHLEPVLDMLPVSSFDFDLAVLADSEVVAPTPTSPGHHLQRLRELFAGSNEVRMVVHAVAPRVVASCYDAARRGNHVTRGVVTPDVTEAIRADEAVREQVREMVEWDAMVLHERPSVPFQFGLYDGVGAISADDEDGIPHGIVVTEAPPVREWMTTQYERLRTDARELPAETFATAPDD